MSAIIGLLPVNGSKHKLVKVSWTVVNGRSQA